MKFVMRLSETQSDYTALIMGNSGTGKTHLLGTLCQAVPTVIITSDIRGLDTLRDMQVDPEIVLIESWEDIMESFQALRDAINGGIRAIGVDDFGAIQDRLHDRIIMRPQGRQEERMRPDVRARAIQDALVKGERRLMLRQWGEVSVASDAYLDMLLGLPCKLKVVTVLEELRDHPRSGEDHLFPNLLGSMRYDILARFSLVGSTFIGAYQRQAYYCLTTRPHPRIPTKDRYGKPRTWINPTAEQLLAHMRGADEVPETELEKRIGTGIET